MWDFETSEPHYTSTHMHMHMHTDRACLLTLKEPLVQADELLWRVRATVQERLEVLQLRDSHAKAALSKRIKRLGIPLHRGAPARPHSSSGL